MDILETDRTIIREFTIEDTNQAIEFYSDVDVMRFVGNGKGFSLEETEEFIIKMVDRYEEHGFSFWAVVSKRCNKLIGHCGLMLNRTTGIVEIGYTIAKQYWRQGYALETSRAVLSYGFNTLNLNEIVAFTKKINTPSQGMMKRLGMKFWKNYSKNEIEYIAFKINKLSFLKV